jgi:hypothetical protein
LVFSSSQNRNLTVTSGGVTTPTINYGVTPGPALLLATFTADSTTQLFIMNGLGLNNRTQLSGFVLTQPVPEPSTVALIGLGVAVLMFRRRRAGTR